MLSLSSPAWASRAATRRMPPARSRSDAMKRPPGTTSVSVGVFAEMASKSSIVSAMPASRAIASRCSTAFVDPAVAATAVIALSNAARVRILLGRRSSATSFMTISPARAAAPPLRAIDRRHVVEAHRRQAQHLARHRHRVGGELAAARARARTGDVFQRAQVALGHAAGRARAHRLEHVLDGDVLAAELARHDRPAVQHQPRPIQPRQRHHRPRDASCRSPTARRRRRTSRRSTASSIESAITSRDTSDARIPSVPMLMPSETTMVLNSIGVPPAARMPSFTFAPSSRRCRLHGRGVGPGVRHRDERLLQIRVVEPGRLQHRPRRRAVDALLYCVAVHSRALIPCRRGVGRGAGPRPPGSAVRLSRSAPKARCATIVLSGSRTPALCAGAASARRRRAGARRRRAGARRRRCTRPIRPAASDRAP